MPSRKHVLHLVCFQINTISMKKKSTPKEKTSLERTIENNTDKKNAWKKIIRELEKVESIRKGLMDD